METVFIPLINPNEPEALLAALFVVEGQQVAAGDPLCTLETTKATADVTAEKRGYIAGLRYAAGETARAGEVFCYLAEHPGEAPPATAAPAPGMSPGHEPPTGLRISAPALELARSRGLDLTRLPNGPLVTEPMVRALLEESAQRDLIAPASAFDPQSVIVYGGGGHGKSLIDLLLALRTYRVVGIVDDGIPAGQTVMGVPVLGGAEALADLVAQGVRLAVNAVGGIGDVSVRVKVFHTLAEAGFVCPAVVHPSAVVEPSATLAAGVQVFPHAYVGSEARLGYGVIVNTGAIVSHDCSLGDYANISPGVLLAGGVLVGHGTLLGMGVTVNLGVKVGVGVRVGNGATVKADIPDKGLVRAGVIWPIDR